MKKEIFALFDMDGVVLDTEPQYDIIWKEMGKRYVPEIPDFEKKIKGTILPNILSTYFSHLKEADIKNIEKTIYDFELKMDFKEIPGAFQFIKSLKEAGIKTALVTSSGEEKVEVVAQKFDFDILFDTIVAAGRIKQGKPDPMCYLLAAQDLNADPVKCFVFEDSFAGIQAGTAAGMQVIGLSTTNPRESIEDKVICVIPDFRSFTLSDLYALGGI